MKAFTPLFQAVIAFVAVLTGLGFVFSLILSPVKKDIEHLKAGQAKFDNEVKEIKAGQVKLEGKLDQVLFELKGHSHNPPKQAQK